MNSHTLTNSGIYKQVSADFIEGIRKYVEETLGYRFLYLQGAAGDHMPTSEIAAENPTRDIYEYGKMVGAYIKTCLQSNMQPVAAGHVKVHAFIFKGRVYHEEDHLLARAEKVLEYIEITGDYSSTMAHTLGLISRHHASAIVRRAKLGEYIEERLFVFSIGDVGFAAAPHELFCDAGKAIREGSPFAATFVMGYSDASNGYLPIRRAYEYDSYEEACTNFAPGVAEEMVEEFTKKWATLR